MRAWGSGAPLSGEMPPRESAAADAPFVWAAAVPICSVQLLSSVQFQDDIKRRAPFDGDDIGRMMHPRSSFKAFLEVVKWRSVPWEDVEMDAIHSLQLILRDPLQDEDANRNNIRSIVKAPSDDMKKIQGLLELRTVTNEMVRLIETATARVLAVDIAGNINGWNKKAAELTGLPVMEAIGRPLIDLVVVGKIC